VDSKLLEKIIVLPLPIFILNLAFIAPGTINFDALLRCNSDILVVLEAEHTVYFDVLFDTDKMIYSVHAVIVDDNLAVL
jgi:hypothetical protein